MMMNAEAISRELVAAGLPAKAAEVIAKNLANGASWRALYSEPGRTERLMNTGFWVGACFGVIAFCLIAILLMILKGGGL